MTKTIRHEFYYAHPPEMVWAYLTTSELMAQWLMPNDFKPVAGHEFRFRVNPMPEHQFDGNIYCKVLEINPFKSLVYSWKSGSGNGEMLIDSIVRWTLRPDHSGTALFLEHSGINAAEHPAMYDMMNAGWMKNIRKIADLLNLA